MVCTGVPMPLSMKDMPANLSKDINAVKWWQVNLFIMFLQPCHSNIHMESTSIQHLLALQSMSFLHKHCLSLARCCAANKQVADD